MKVDCPHKPRWSWLTITFHSPFRGNKHRKINFEVNLGGWTKVAERGEKKVSHYDFISLLLHGSFSDPLSSFHCHESDTVNFSCCLMLAWTLGPNLNLLLQKLVVWTWSSSQELQYTHLTYTVLSCLHSFFKAELEPLCHCQLCWRQQGNNKNCTLHKLCYPVWHCPSNTLNRNYIRLSMDIFYIIYNRDP